mmetsp:Transcript_18137/g.28167  ORF Transcript_18137/g.28167 Transcript_18137/m.28167 type:complete len:98 (+) Transcript_18137:38-331(+)
MKRSHTLPAIVALLFCASAVGATSQDARSGILTYAIFEEAIEHADLATCPPAFVSDDTFCRLTLANEQAHVFVFSNEDDQPMIAVQSYELTDTGFSY